MKPEKVFSIEKFKESCRESGDSEERITSMLKDWGNGFIGLTKEQIIKLRYCVSDDWLDYPLLNVPTPTANQTGGLMNKIIKFVKRLLKRNPFTPSNIKITFAKVRPDATIPSKSVENAGYDIYANFKEDFILLKKGTVTLVPTGIASALPLTHYFQLAERGSTGTKGMVQHCGVIDSGYRNEWFVPIGNYTDKDIAISKFPEYHEDIIVYPYEKAICQAILIEVPETVTEEVSYEELLLIKSERGLGKLGSTGK